MGSVPHYVNTLTGWGQPPQCPPSVEHFVKQDFSGRPSEQRPKQWGFKQPLYSMKWPDY